jgi:hypothetical protein
MMGSLYIIVSQSVAIKMYYLCASSDAAASYTRSIDAIVGKRVSKYRLLQDLRGIMLLITWVPAPRPEAIAVD